MGASELPAEYQRSIRLLDTRVCSSPVTGVFLSNQRHWGTGPTPDPKRPDVIWTHFRIESPTVSRLSATKSSELAEDYKTLRRALAEFDQAVVRRCVGLLESEALYRSERFLGPAKWLLDLHVKLGETKDRNRQGNLVWLAVGTAPAGFAHVRSGVLGTLLEDLAAGKPHADVAAAFAKKLDPRFYQRPQAPPSTGTIDQAERTFAATGAATALRRRFAQLEDLDCLWRPRSTPETIREAIGGVFAHLRQPTQTQEQSSGAPPQVMTWSKFATKVLPTAERVVFLVPFGSQPFAALTTAADPTAPNMLRWGNPVSWYQYAEGSPAGRWGLSPGARVAVEAVCLSPPHWGGQETPGESHSAFLILEGCRDSQPQGLAIFPETLRAEYHGVRAVIEAHSKRGTLEGREEATACGYMLQGTARNDRRPWDATLQVLSTGLWTGYRLDRWD